MGSSCCSLTLMVLLLLLVPHSLGDTQALINQVCRQTDDSNFCRNVFVRNLPSPNTDVKGLTQIALTKTITDGSNTLKFVQKLEAAETDKEILGLLKVCETSYGVLVNQFQHANSAFARGDYKEVSFTVGKCDRIVPGCESTLGGRVPQLNIQNPQNRVLVEMSIVSARLIGS